jgi:hypothetical protein
MDFRSGVRNYLWSGLALAAIRFIALFFEDLSTPKSNHSLLFCHKNYP